MSDQFDVTALQQPEAVDYEAAKAGFVVPQPGRYQVQAPETIAFEQTKPDAEGKRYLAALLDPMEVYEDGRKIFTLRFTRVNTKKFGKSPVNTMALYLIAQGVEDKPQTNEEYMGLVQATQGRICLADLQWEGYCESCQKTTLQSPGKRGSTVAEFPKDEQGFYVAALCPICGSKVRVNLRVRRFVTG